MLLLVENSILRRRNQVDGVNSIIFNRKGGHKPLSFDLQSKRDEVQEETGGGRRRMEVRGLKDLIMDEC